MAKPVTTAPIAATAPAPPTSPDAGWAPAGRQLRRVLERREIAIFLVAVVLFVYFSTTTSAFATVDNMVTMTQFMAPIAAIGAAEAVILTTGEVDLSSGTAFIFFPFVVYFLWANAGVPLVAAILVALACAAVFGLLNGVLTTMFGLPSFVTTLATFSALYGVMLVTSNSVQETFSLTGTGGNVLGGYSWSEILWALGCVAFIFYLLHLSRFGSHVVAAGGNLLGAAEAGVPVQRVKIWSFMMISVISAFIGIIDAARITTLDPGNDGTQEMFYAIAAAIIGGTAMTGGRGTIIGSLIGALVLGILYDGLDIKGVNASYFQLVLGVAILAAMIANVQLRRAAMRRWRSIRR
ncbi:MAG: ABC transporter permease [Acidimicrobiales bacterium]